MGKRVFFSVVIAALIVMTLPIGVSAQESEGPAQVGLRPDAPLYALHGPYWAGTMELVIEDEERPLQVTIWYPALNPDSLEEHYTYEMNYAPGFFPFSIDGHALPEAEGDSANAPYPLVVFSHMLQGWRTMSVYLTEHLASYGFVVISVDHTGETIANFEKPFWQHYHYRPLDITRVIAFADELTASEGPLSDLINTEQVAVTGHSSGGWTSLAAAGAQMDFGALQTYCDEHAAEMLVEDCSQLLRNADALAMLFGLDSAPEGLWPAIYDERVAAIVPLSPDTNHFGARGFAAIKVPTMILVGSLDRFIPPEYNVFPRYHDLGSLDKSLVVFDGADHMMFANSCDTSPWLIDIGAFMACSDPVWDMDRAHDLINHFVTAFLLAELYGDEDAVVALAPDAVQFSGIQYETTGF